MSEQQNPNDNYPVSRPNLLTILMLIAIAIGIGFLFAYSGEVEAYLSGGTGR